MKQSCNVTLVRLCAMLAMEVVPMKQQYIPLEKRSKREQKKYFAARRGSWGDINPVTKMSKNPKAYNRKKSGQWYEHEPLPGFCYSPAL